MMILPKRYLQPGFRVSTSPSPVIIWPFCYLVIGLYLWLCVASLSHVIMIYDFFFSFFLLKTVGYFWLAAKNNAHYEEWVCFIVCLMSVTKKEIVKASQSQDDSLKQSAWLNNCNSRLHYSCKLRIIFLEFCLVEKQGQSAKPVKFNLLPLPDLFRLCGLY